MYGTLIMYCPVQSTEEARGSSTVTALWGPHLAAEETEVH